MPLVFTQNDTLFNLTLEVLQDAAVEEDEVFTVQLVVPENENAVTLKNNIIAVTIVDDDSEPI